MSWDEWEDGLGLHLPGFGSMTFARLSPDALRLAAHMAEGTPHPEGCTCEWCSQLRATEESNPDRDRHVALQMAAGLTAAEARQDHPEGCTCDYCSQLRAAVGRMRHRDKYISEVVSGKTLFKPGPDRKPCGCLPYIVCGHPRPATPPAKAARPGPCTCNAPHSGDWRAHPPGCPRRAALIKAMRQEREGKPEPEEPKMTPDPERELRAELGEPLGLDAAELERRLPYSAPGACVNCHTPLKPPRNERCSWCDALNAARAAMQPEPKQPPARQRNPVPRPLRHALQAGMLGFICIVLASYVPSLGFLIIPGSVLLAMALVLRRRA